MVVVLVFGVKAELKNSHSGEACAFKKLTDAVKHFAEIFCNNINLAKLSLNLCPKIHSRTFKPFSVHGV